MPIRGRFYLRLTSNGNLTGEFSHYQDNCIYTESADRRAGDPFDEFPGTYHSTWREPPNQSVIAQLVIARIAQSRLYDLTWSDPVTHAPTFRGQAMIMDGMLIGDYHSA